MELEFDNRKNASNLLKHGLSFKQVVDLNWNEADTRPDFRSEYNEMRYITYAKLGNRLCMVAWTLRGDTVRSISFRKANAKERKRYEKEKND